MLSRRYGFMCRISRRTRWAHSQGRATKRCVSKLLEALGYVGGVQLSEGAPAFVDRASAAGRRLQRGSLRGSQAVWGAVRSFGTPSRPSRLTPERRTVNVGAEDGRQQAAAPAYWRGVKLRIRRQAARVGGQCSYPNLNRTVEQRRDAAARRFRDVRAPHLTLLTRRGLKSREVRPEARWNRNFLSATRREPRRSSPPLLVRQSPTAPPLATPQLPRRRTVRLSAPGCGRGREGR